MNSLAHALAALQEAETLHRRARPGGRTTISEIVEHLKIVVGDLEARERGTATEAAKAAANPVWLDPPTPVSEAASMVENAIRFWLNSTSVEAIERVTDRTIAVDLPDGTTVRIDVDRYQSDPSNGVPGQP